MSDSILDPFSTPLYRVRDAAAYVGVSASTYQDWARGSRVSTAARRPPVITRVPATGRGPSIPFIGLAESMVLSAVRHAGVPLQRIRPAIDELRHQIGVDHALASKRLFTDGAEILFDFGESNSDAAETARELVVLRNGQRVFTEVVEKYLRRLEFGQDGYVRLIHLPEFAEFGLDVVADPRRSFGQPIFARGAVRVDDVMDRIRSGEGLELVAEDFGLSSDDLVNLLRANASRQAA